MEKVLGLDISTSVAGWCISDNAQILDMGFIDISDLNTHKEKAAAIILTLQNKTFDKIQVEESLSGFSFGRTSQQVVLKLAVNKSVVCYILGEHYNIPITFHDARTMRKQLFGKAFIKGIKSKEFVKHNIEKMFDISPWIVKNKRGNVDKRMEDAYDAIVCSMFRSK